MKTFTLSNNVTTVPKDSKVYANRSKFDIALLNIVDTSVVYEEYNTDKNALMRLAPCIDCRVYGVYKFYPNGYFNAFYLDRDKLLSATEFNPSYAGKRGVYYTEGGKTRFDIYAETDQRQNLGRITGTLIFSGDTMYLKKDEPKNLNKTTYPPRVFLKRKLPPEYFIYRADW